MRLLAAILIALATGCVSQSYWEFGSESIQSVLLLKNLPPGNYDAYECATSRPAGRLIQISGDTTKTIHFCVSRSRSNKNARLNISGAKAELCLFQEHGSCIDNGFCESSSTADDCVAVTPNNAVEDVCGYRTRFDGTVFSLRIRRTFHPLVVFELCAREEPLSNFVLIRTESADRTDLADRQLPLDEPTFARVLALYEDALEYDVKYASTGADGSTWCLETKRGFTYSVACFWTPAHKTGKRSLNGLLALGKELWQLADMDAMELY